MTFRFSNLLAGFIILLSLFAFSGSVAANAGTRESFNSEVSSKKNTGNTRSISLKQGQELLQSIQFFHTGTLVSMVCSRTQVERLLHLSMLHQQKQETNPAEIVQAIRLHAPRSTPAVNSLG